MADRLDNRYFVVHYTLLGLERWRVTDVANPNKRVKDLHAKVDQDEFDNEEEADQLCAQLNKQKN